MINRLPGTVDEATRTRAGTQVTVRGRVAALAIRSGLSPKLRNSLKASRPVTHGDLSRCLSGGVVTDVGSCTGGVLATVLGTDLEGQDLTVVVYVPDDDDLLIVEEFLAT
jgi:hypothetical protein